MEQSLANSEQPCSLAQASHACNRARAKPRCESPPARRSPPNSRRGLSACLPHSPAEADTAQSRPAGPRYRSGKNGSCPLPAQRKTPRAALAPCVPATAGCQSRHLCQILLVCAANHVFSSLRDKACEDLRRGKRPAPPQAVGESPGRRIRVRPSPGRRESALPALTSGRTYSFHSNSNSCCMGMSSLPRSGIEA